RGAPSINATSTDEIGLMLLVFFLLATSMGVKKSIRRELPPLTDSVRVEPLRVKERDLLVLRLDGEGRLFAGPEEIPLTDVKERVKHFIANPDNEESLPEKHSREVPLLGTVEVTDTHVIALRYDPHTDYRTYFEVQNLLLEAYHELRDAEAEKRFHCTFDRATSEQQEAIRACYPQRISETMTAEEKGGRD
uniref:ExbD/TolR family protein n=1 Tax=Phocaeicola sp. TaxID=2773926 RepID=UPI003FED4F63